jgi:hypothetical protein
VELSITPVCFGHTDPMDFGGRQRGGGRGWRTWRFVFFLALASGVAWLGSVVGVLPDLLFACLAGWALGLACALVLDGHPMRSVAAFFLGLVLVSAAPLALMSGASWEWVLAAGVIGVYLLIGGGVGVVSAFISELWASRSDVSADAAGNSGGNSAQQRR